MFKPKGQIEKNYTVIRREKMSLLGNFLWIVLGGLIASLGWELALGHLIIGSIFCITIVGIPFGLQDFKLAQLALIPFGSVIR